MREDEEMEDGIDFVITWVDGNDPAWRSERKQFADASGLSSDARFRDWNLLRYWFRAVEKYAPWVRKIHFVTWGHLPAWLDTGNPKLHIVKHADFIPSEYLPTFNSHTIELNLHRIEGLSERFVYFNDDVFLLRPTGKEFFFRDGLPCDSFGLSSPQFSSRTIGTIAAASTAIINDAFDKASAFRKNRRKIYDPRNGIKRILRTKILSRIYKRYFPGFEHWHVTYSFLKTTFNEVWTFSGKELRLTCLDKFRGRNNVSPCVMKYWQLASGNFAPRGTSGGIAIHLKSDKSVQHACHAILSQKYNVACLNDTSFLRDVDGAMRSILGAFSKMLPQPSSFELPVSWFQHDLIGESHGYAVMAEDQIRQTSSSGGMFTLLAEEILRRGGVVCGAAFDSDLKCRYRLVSNISELKPLRGSKYVQSVVPAGLFPEIKRHLENGRPVMFTGTPCHAEALRRFIGRQDRNLLTVDFVCAGVPAPRYFDKYLNDAFGKDNVVGYDFRNKVNGWRPTLCLSFKDGTVTYRSLKEDEYMRAFSAKFTILPGCFNCRFANQMRRSDITLGDFWGCPKEVNDGLGTSLVMVNTLAGVSMFESVRGRMKKVQWYDLCQLSKGNSRLASAPPKHPRYQSFQIDVERMPFKEAVKENLKRHPRSVAILNFHFESMNYGAVLTAYALNKALNSMGYLAQNINFRPPLPRLLRKGNNPLMDEFRRRRLPMTCDIDSLKRLKLLNRRFSSFVVGSDQVWNHKLTEWFADLYFLPFAKAKRRRIAIAASFGDDPMQLYGRRTLRSLLSPFTAISVREQSAAKSLQKIGIAAKPVCDPVFLIPCSEWREMAADSSEVPSENVCVWYGVNAAGRAAIRRYLPACWRVFQGGVYNLRNLSVEEWLARVANASLLVTDSFHGTCFALIFGVPFAVIAPKGTKQGRIRNLLDAVGLSNRIFENETDMPSPEELSKPYDTSAVAEKLSEMARELREFMDESLSSPLANKQTQKGKAKKELLIFAFKKSVCMAFRMPFACCKKAILNPLHVRKAFCQSLTLSWQKICGYLSMANRQRKI